MSTSLKRLGWILLIAVGLIASLLTFPAAIPWMLAGWLLCASVLMWRGRAGWIPLAVGGVIVLVKNVDWPPALVVLGGVMLSVGVGRILFLWKRTEPSPTGRGRFIDGLSLVALWGAWLAVVWSWSASANSSEPAQLQGERPVVCLGDSLTAFGYPEELGKLLAVPVINMGTDGITTGDALNDLPRLNEANPQAVVIELGGHDYLKGKTRAATKENLQTIVDASQALGAEVIIMEVPRGFIFDPFGGIEREFARENDLELISDGVIRNLVLWSPFSPPGMWFSRDRHLSDDGLHPNNNGNKYMAKHIAETLAGRFREGILAE